MDAEQLALQDHLDTLETVERDVSDLLSGNDLPPCTIIAVSEILKKIEGTRQRVSAKITTPIAYNPEPGTKVRKLQDLDDVDDSQGPPCPRAAPSSLAPLPDGCKFFEHPGTVNGRVDTILYIMFRVMNPFYTLYQRRPDHPIFGPRQQAVVACPLVAQKKTEASWYAKVLRFAKAIAGNMGTSMVEGSCWMGTEAKIFFDCPTKTKSPNIPDRVTIPWYRLLYFLTDVTEENWLQVAGGDAAHSHLGASSTNPFLHYCNNGHGSRKGQKLGCLNSIEHGRFGSTRLNNDMTKCPGVTFSSTCGGHDGRRCYAVHPSGEPKLCFNQVIQPLQCDGHQEVGIMLRCG